MISRTGKKVLTLYQYHSNTTKQLTMKELIVTKEEHFEESHEQKLSKYLELENNTETRILEPDVSQ